ncbi:ribosomal protein L7/L12 [Acinetobacter courvalinii]|uniref:ribosomal protein L7/L12 n=1 Tax=Acinetobacter courvalinii TaxID=280147 RepID=UPI0019024757|nr:ribosomal protein L7/L12 [Acinetobacter courvalinii]MBJ9958348.1 ribosomal protein L7/L12 [Acinetobacter courvalinii]
MSSLPHIPPEALDVLREGQLIEAIKITREKTGLGLKESKDLIDQYLQAHPQEQARVQQQVAQRSRGGVKLVVFIVVLLTILIWWIMK